MDIKPENLISLLQQHKPLPQAQVLDALRKSGSTLVLIEDKNQTGCVLPDGYTIPDNVFAQ